MTQELSLSNLDRIVLAAPLHLPFGFGSSVLAGMCCSVLQCAAVCCSVLQCVAVCCSVLQCVAVCWHVVDASGGYAKEVMSHVNEACHLCMSHGTCE